MTSPLNRAFLRIPKRADQNEEHLAETFVQVGPLFDLLSTKDHQILYGRRGTGKTHALQYLGDAAKRAGDLPVYIDMRTIGSTTAVYADTALSITERGYTAPSRCAERSAGRPR